MERYPLSWPTGQARTPPHLRRDAQFSVDFGRARDDLLHELDLLGAKDIVLSTCIPLRRDGLPYSGMAEPEDPGVAVYFDRVKWISAEKRDQRTPFVIACDSYRKVKWNTRAVGVTVEALRSIQRHGATSMLEQAFTGFAALPAKAAERPWWSVLGLPENATPDEVRARYRELAAENHPDKGGDASRMVEINQAYALARVCA
jgi:hypothetical protein